MEKAGPATVCPWGPLFRRGREVREELGPADPLGNRERLAASQASWLQGAWDEKNVRVKRHKVLTVF